MSKLTPAERRALEDAAEGEGKGAKVIRAFLDAEEGEE